MSKAAKGRASLTGLWWWVDRWKASTAYMDMTLEEQGAYRNLLDEAFLRGGPLPKDERILAKACGDALAWKKVRAAVMPHFYDAADGWRNETLDGVIAESQRRADKQHRYRNRGAATDPPDGNADGNGTGNAVGNARGNEEGRKGGNAAGSLDLDLDLDLGSDSGSESRAARARGRVFSGRRLKVSERQHEVLCDELGAIAERLDLLGKYERWDAELEASGEDFDVLEYIKRRAREAAKALRRAGPIREVRSSASEDWFAECQRLHDRRCNGQYGHAKQMAIDAERAMAVGE